MTRHAIVTVVLLGACGGKQPAPAPDEAPDDEQVAIVPDAAPEPFVPEVPPLERPTDIADLRTRLAASQDDHERLIAAGLLAEALWQSSCAADQGGICLADVERSKKAPATCDGHTSDRVATPRTAAARDEAVLLTGEIRKLWGGGSALLAVGDPPTRVDAAAYVTNVHVAEEVAAALLVLGDDAAERLLAIPVPTKLDYTSTKQMNATVARRQAWFEASTTALTAALEQYEMVYDDPDLQRWAPDAVILSLVRSGWLYVELGRRFRGAEVPKGAKGDAKASYCEARSGEGLELLLASGAAWESCVVFGKRIGSNNHWLDVCEAGLQTATPTEQGTTP